MVRQMLYVLFLLSVTGTGCTMRVADFTLISSKNMELSHAAAFERGKERVQAEDMVHWIIIVPTGVPNWKEAVDRAIESTPGAVALIDVVVEERFWWIPFIYGRQAWVVEGIPVIDPALR